MLRLVHCIDLIARCKRATLLKRATATDAANRDVNGQNRRHSPRWYKMELIAVKKNSLTISTLPLSVITVSFAVIVSWLWWGCCFGVCSSSVLVVTATSESGGCVANWLTKRGKPMCQLVEDELQFDFSVSKSSPCSLRLEAASSIIFWDKLRVTDVITLQLTWHCRERTSWLEVLIMR